ncbi:MAG: NrsF family protein [Hyphomicrobium sp.]|jgi:hypothetical protein
MKTEHLITALVADRSSIERPISRTIALYTAGGALLSGLLFFWLIGLRPDFATASETLRFQFKFVVTIALLIPAFVIAWRLSTPEGQQGGWLWALLIAPTALAAACVVDLAVLDPAEWKAKLVGSNSIICVTVIPLLSLPPLTALLFALSQGLTTRPTLAGLAAGLASAALAATLYASNCTDDSPLFVATWYTMAIAAVTMVGAIIGSYVLRW